MVDSVIAQLPWPLKGVSALSCLSEDVTARCRQKVLDQVKFTENLLSPPAVNFTAE